MYIHWKRISLILTTLLSTVVRSDSSCHISASQAYVKAVVSHSKADADAVPLEDDVVRYEGPPGVSIVSAYGAKNLRQSLQFGASAFTVYAASNERYSVLNATTVEAVYDINVGLIQGAVPLTQAKVDEFFTFKSAYACKIQRINAVFYVGQT